MNIPTWKEKLASGVETLLYVAGVCLLLVTLWQMGCIWSCHNTDLDPSVLRR